MTKKVDIDKSWYEVLNGEFDKPYFFKIREFVRMEYKNKVIFPEPKDIFNAFNSTSFNQVKVVIVGQDPYHGDGQAHGLSFSVNKGVDIPPSLKNIFKEIEDDLGLMPKNSGTYSIGLTKVSFSLIQCLQLKKESLILIKE